jgi:hypothetical protein
VGRYKKDVEGVDHHYQPDDLFKYAGEPFDVRVSILDEPPDSGLWATVTEDNVTRSIGDILDELVIGREPKQTEFIRENILELDEFPFLSDSLDWVSEIWHRFREGDAELTICVNHGPDNIALEDTPREHMCSCVWRDGSYDYMLLDLVFEPGDMTLLGMLGERKQEFLLWMKGLVALYKLDVDPSSEKHLRKKDELEDVREQLFFHNLVSKGARGKLSITQQGRRAIGRVLEEQDELIERFDVFRDVVIRRSKKGGITAEFGTLSGADYRVAVYEHEDVDPFRAVFLLTLLSGELEEELKGKDWLEKLSDERFYERILAPAVDHSTLDPEELDELVSQGYQFLARTAAQRERASYSQRVLQRAKQQTIQAFPRPRALPEEADPKASDKEGGRKAFVRASKSKPSDELGDTPLPESLPPKSSKAGEDEEPDADQSPASRSGSKFPPPPAQPVVRRTVTRKRGPGPGGFPPPPRGGGISNIPPGFPPPPSDDPEMSEGGPPPQPPVPPGGRRVRFRGGARPAPATPHARPKPSSPKRDDDDGWL